MGIGGIPGRSKSNEKDGSDGKGGIDRDGIGSAGMGTGGMPGRSVSKLKMGSAGKVGIDRDGIGSAGIGSVRLQLIARW